MCSVSLRFFPIRLSRRFPASDCVHIPLLSQLIPVFEQVACPKWITSEIENSNHGHEFSLNRVVNAEWKTLRQRSMETINDLVNSTEVDQRFDVRKNARSKLITQTETLTLIKPIAVCNIGFSTRRDSNFHFPSFCNRSLASDQGETDMRPSSICF
jgi:hypothetical protein